MKKKDGSNRVCIDYRKQDQDEQLRFIKQILKIETYEDYVIDDGLLKQVCGR